MVEALQGFIGTAQASSTSEAAAGSAAAGFVGLFFIVFVLLQMFIWGLAIASLVFWIFMLVDVVQRTNWENEQDKTTWVLIVVLAGIIGALIYYFSIRKKLGPANKPHPPAKTHN
jgi:TctA family transporter